MQIKKLDSGWILVKKNSEVWAQVPPGWKGEIPDEYIFHPEWNRDEVNRIWAERNWRKSRR